MKKKLALLILCLLMLLGGVCRAEAVPPTFEAPAPAPQLPVPPTIVSTNKDTDALDFSINSRGEITGYSGMEIDIEIPSMVNGIRVTAIASNAFANQYDLTSVVVPEGVVRIGGSAFAKCYNLTTISLPKSLEKIEGWTFHQCKSLSSIVIPEGVESVGYCAFYECNALKTVSLPDSLHTIEGWAFAKCTSLKELIMPEGVTSAGECMFYQCTSLERLVLSDQIDQLGEYFASGCTKLKQVNLPNSTVRIDKYAFFGCAQIESIRIPDALVSIDEYAFYGCSALSGTLVFPSGMKSIGLDAFKGCRGIERAELPDGMEALAEGSLPPEAVIVFGSSALIEGYVVSHGMQFICDGRDTTQGDFDTVDEKIDWVLNTYLSPGMSEYERALRLYNWLCANVAYDYQWLETNVPTSEYGVTEEGALLGGWAVCQGYAEAYVHLLTETGIDALYTNGEAGDGRHAWVLARIEGEWYQFDPTWDEAGNGSSHVYFGLTDYAMRFNHTQEINKHIICDSYECNYDYRTGEYDELLLALAEEIDNKILDMEFTGFIDAEGMKQPAYFWNGPAPYTVAFILGQKTDWAIPGRAELVPAEPGFSFRFYPDEDPVTAMTVLGLNKSEYIDDYQLMVSDTVQLTVLTEPQYARVSYSSSNPAVLTVSESGLITAVSDGIATLTIRAGGYSVEMDIVVSSRSIRFEEDSYEGTAGERLVIHPLIGGDEAGSYRHTSKYIRIEVFGGDAVDYAGYYEPEWKAAHKCWSYPFAADCISPGAVTLVATLNDESGVSGSVRVIVHDAAPLELVASVKEIEQEAFMGLKVKEIVLPEGVERIGARAFADSTELELINLPATLTDIAHDAFEGCEGVTLLCQRGTFAHDFAQGEGLDFMLVD